MSTKPDRRFFVGDAVSAMRTNAIGPVAACVTSPPYFGLRRYGDSETHEIGQQAHGIDRYIANLVEVFTEIRRLGHRDTQFWINIGDTANAYQHNRGAGGVASAKRHADRQVSAAGLTSPAHHNKSFLAIPQRFTVAMVDAGFCLRAAIAWEANRIPESTKSRPHRRTESILFFTQHDRCAVVPRDEVPDHLRFDIWRLPTSKSTAHPAAFAQAVPAACLSWLPTTTAGCVLDPFAGSGTTLDAAAAIGRDAVGIDLYDWPSRV